jgi:spermidine synthase
MLQVGLGIGTSAAGMQQHGVTVNAIEIHPVVIALAKQFFGCVVISAMERVDHQWLRC